MKLKKLMQWVQPIYFQSKCTEVREKLPELAENGVPAESHGAPE